MGNLDRFFRSLDQSSSSVNRPTSRHTPPKAKSIEEYAGEIIEGLIYTNVQPLTGSQRHHFTRVGGHTHTVPDEQIARAVLDLLEGPVKKDIADRFGITPASVLLNVRVVKQDDGYTVAFDSAHEEHLDDIQWRGIRTRIYPAGPGSARQIP